MAADSETAITAFLAEEEDFEDSLHFPAILRDLLTTPDTSPADAARRMHEEYTDVYLPSDPLLKG